MGKKKLDGYGKDFSHPENYSSSENIQKIVSKIEDTQVKMSQDYEKLSKLKKAAKKAAEAAAAKKAAEEEAAAEKAKEAAAAKAKEEAAKAAETTAAPKETSKAAEAAPTTTAAAFTKEPLMMVATDSEASFGLWYFLAGSFCLASVAYVFHRMSRKWGYREIKPLLRRGENYN